MLHSEYLKILHDPETLLLFPVWQSGKQKKKT